MFSGSLNVGRVDLSILKTPGPPLVFDPHVFTLTRLVVVSRSFLSLPSSFLSLNAQHHNSHFTSICHTSLTLTSPSLTHHIAHRIVTFTDRMNGHPDSAQRPSLRGGDGSINLNFQQQQQPPPMMGPLVPSLNGYGSPCVPFNAHANTAVVYVILTPFRSALFDGSAISFWNLVNRDRYT